MRTQRRRRRTSRTYSLAELLARQPKTLRCHPRYEEVLAHYNTSERLRRLRVSSRCFRLLNEGRVAPENLTHFYRTYRLPADPFFPLFFTIKRDYLADRRRIREERHQYALNAVRSLPPPLLAQFKYLGHLERHYNAAGESPVWQQYLFPSSKKQADRYRRMSQSDWHAVYRSHLLRLTERYPRLTPGVAQRVLACFILGFTPASAPPAQPAASEIAKRYRELSLRHHPDRGGDPAMFMSIKRARDSLITSKHVTS